MCPVKQENLFPALYCYILPLDNITHRQIIAFLNKLRKINDYILNVLNFTSNLYPQAFALTESIIRQFGNSRNDLSRTSCIEQHKKCEA